MHTDSSARRTCFRSRSAVECTATVLMPSSLQARQMRKAISPRLAMTILSNICSVHLKLIGSLFDDEKRLIVPTMGLVTMWPLGISDLGLSVTTGAATGAGAAGGGA